MNEIASKTYQLSVVTIPQLSIELLQDLLDYFQDRPKEEIPDFLVWVICDLCLHEHQDVASAALRCLRKLRRFQPVLVIKRLLKDSMTSQRVIYNSIRLVRKLEIKEALPLISERVDKEPVSDALKSLILTTYTELGTVSGSITRQALKTLLESQKAVNLEKTVWVSAFIYLINVHRQLSKQVDLLDEGLKKEVDHFFTTTLPSIRVYELQYLGTLPKKDAAYSNELMDSITLTQQRVLQFLQSDKTIPVALLRELYDLYAFNQEEDFKTKLNQQVKSFYLNKKTMGLGALITLLCGLEDFLPDLKKYIASAKDHLNPFFINYLGRLKWPQVGDIVKELLESCNRKEVQSACLSYFNFNKQGSDFGGNTKVERLAFRLLNEKEAHLNLIAATFLSHYFPGSWDQIISRIKKGSVPLSILRELINCLGRFSVKEVAEFLATQLSDNKKVTTEVILALQKNNSQRANEVLFESIRNEEIDLLMRVQIADHIDVEMLDFDGDAFDQLDFKNFPTELKEALFDLRDRIEMRKTYELAEVVRPTESQNDPKVDIQIDEHVRKNFPEFDQLSEPIKRSIRTSEIFYRNLMNWYHSDIDLSPIVNVQNKAVELLFKELFDKEVEWVVKRSGVQKKLDYLGYTRGHKAKLGKFESFLGDLPYVKEVPYFSATKLKKMLIALCAYNPHRKFVLDGIKAYALFFLAFARSECPFGLAKVMKVGTRTDDELLSFCRDIHMMQDTRNRLTHESASASFQTDVQNFRDKAFAVMKKMFQMSQRMKQV